MYERIAAQAPREGQSLNAAMVDLLECVLDAYEQVDTAETHAREKMDWPILEQSLTTDPQAYPFC